MSAKCRKFMFQFAHEHLDFKITELKSVASIFGIKLTIPEDYNIKLPYVVVELPSDECARKLSSRAVMVKSVYELWASGCTYPELCTHLRKISPHFTDRYVSPHTSIRIIVESFNKQLTQKEKISRIETLMDEMKFQGKIQLKAPEHSFHILEYYEEPEGRLPSEHPSHIHFGRWIADGQRNSIKLYDLRNRKFIGNTSMDPGLSLIMANQAKVQSGDFVFDPFVGTGSLLVAAAHYGAYVMGTDMDYNLLHGKGLSSRSGQKWRGKDENIRCNLRQYGLEGRYIDAIVADSSKNKMLRSDLKFDVILTDPPYGIREPTHKVGTKVPSQGEKVSTAVTVDCEEHQGEISEMKIEKVQNPDDIANPKAKNSVQYHISQIYKDLLNFSALYLKLGGRLVFWLPIYRAEYKPSHIPRHPCFQLSANSEQIFSIKCSRRLITMVKILDSQDESTLNGATLDYDPFENDSFRQKYFFWSQEQIQKDAAENTTQNNITISRKKMKRMENKKKHDERLLADADLAAENDHNLSDKISKQRLRRLKKAQKLKLEKSNTSGGDPHKYIHSQEESKASKTESSELYDESTSSLNDASCVSNVKSDLDSKTKRCDSHNSDAESSCNDLKSTCLYVVNQNFTDKSTFCEYENLEQVKQCENVEQVKQCTENL